MSIITPGAIGFHADDYAPAGSYVAVSGSTSTGEQVAPSFNASGKTGATAFPLILAGSTSSGAPASGAHLKGELAGDATGKLWYCTTAGTPGTWVQIAGGGGSGSVATDTIFDAKGDLPVGTGADTAAKLTVGANDTIPVADSAQTTGIKWAAPSVVRTALSLVPGTDVEAHDTDLTTIAGLTPTNDDVLQRKAGAWANRTIAQLKTDLAITVATDTIWDAKGDLAVGTGADTAAKLTVGTNNAAIVADSGQTTGLKYAVSAGGYTGKRFLHDGGAYSEISNTIAYDATGVSTCVNTTAETTVADLVLPLNYVASGDLVRLVVYWNLINSSGAGVNFTLKAKYGATTLCTAGPSSIATNATRWYGAVNFDLFITSSSTQFGKLHGYGSRGATVNTANTITIGADGTAAEALTSDKHVVLTATLGTASASTDFITTGSLLQYFRYRG